MGLLSMHGSGGEAAGSRYFPPARSCDCCESAAAALFCRADSAFLCIACDSKLHINPHARHERVWMCEVCEQAAAVVSCRADAAVLCSDCDHDIHSANPLARRHDRMPVVPFFENAESVVVDSAAVDCSSLLTDPSLWVPEKLTTGVPEINKSIEFLFSDSDQLLDFEISQHLRSDCVVPVQTTTEPPALSPHRNYSSENRFEIDFSTAHVNSYNNSYTTSSLSHSVSSSSMDLGIVPDSSRARSDMSYAFSSNDMNSVVDVSGNQGLPALGLDREARVLRYREKRKNRRFQKTIRYASRKAYAETRPRIKGRFAKRTHGELETDPVFTTGSPDDYVFDARYDVVMSF